MRIIFQMNKHVPHVDARKVSVNIFTTQKWFRLTSIASCKLHLNTASNHTSCKSFIQNQSSALPRYPSLFLTILKARATEATRSTLRHLESATSTLLHTKGLPCTVIRGLSIKNPFKRIKLIKSEEYQGYFPP